MRIRQVPRCQVSYAYAPGRFRRCIAPASYNVADVKMCITCAYFSFTTLPEGC